MRTLILHFLQNPNENTKYRDVLQKLSQGAQTKAEQVDIRSGLLESDNVPFSLYDYIAVVITPSSPFSAKVSSKVAELFAANVGAQGRKGCALVIKSGLRSIKTCDNLMRLLEKEGMKLDYSDVILNQAHAVAVGKKIG